MVPLLPYRSSHVLAKLFVNHLHADGMMKNHFIVLTAFFKVQTADFTKIFNGNFPKHIECFKTTQVEMDDVLWNDRPVLIQMFWEGVHPHLSSTSACLYTQTCSCITPMIAASFPTTSEIIQNPRAALTFYTPILSTKHLHTFNMPLQYASPIKISQTGAHGLPGDMCCDTSMLIRSITLGSTMSH